LPVRCRQANRRDRRSAASAARAGVLLALLSVAEAAAQRLPFTHFSADDGLAATQVWHVTQDRRGLLWVATTWGLNRFDGSSFSTFSIHDGLPSPNIRLTLEDANGDLWIGTNAGIARYDGSRIESFAGRGGPLASTVWSAGADRFGSLWFATTDGVVAVDGATMRTYGAADGLADDYGYGLHFSKDGAIWIGSRGKGVSRCAVERGGRLGHCRRFTTRDGLANDAVHAFAELADGTLFLATRGGGLSRFDGRSFETLTVADGLPSDDLYALLVRRGELLVGSDSGMGICALPAGRPCRVLSEKNGLPDDGIRYLFEDREGTLWIGAEGGLSRLSREDVLSYGEAEGLPDGHVYALESDGAGGVFVGTVNGLAHLELGAAGAPRVRIWREPDGLPANWVWALVRDRRGDLWIGGERGVSRLKNGRFESWSVADGLAGDYVTGLCEDRRGAIWVASIEGVSRIDPATAGGAPEITAFGVREGLAVPRSYTCREDGQGRVWIGHGEALSWFDGERFHAVAAESGLPARAARSLGIDRGGNFWVGGQGRLARLLPDAPGSPPRFVELDTGDALASDLVLTIAGDGERELILGTSHGVITLDIRSTPAEIVSRFHRASGAPASEVAHSSAFTADSRGRYWFGLKGGATLFLDQPSVARAREIAPATVFERIATRRREFRAPFHGVDPRHQRFGPGSVVVLPPFERTLWVEARALSLAGLGALRFQFRLEGVDPDWSEARPENLREYVQLRPGRYRLEARSRFGEGDWGEPAAIVLVLRPAWYETRAALLLALLAVATVIAALVQWRTRSVAARNRALAAEVAARTDDLARYARALEEQVHALDRANERIRLADRHRGEFLAKMSHELRTPLTSVLGFTALLRDGLEGQVDSRYLRYLRNIRESGNHLLRLINNLLDQAKIEAGRMDLHLEPASVDVIVESAMALVEGFAATRSVNLVERRSGDVPPVTVDVAKLRQIVINLLSNAIKFAPSGSEVEIASRVLAAADSPLDAPSYEIEVKDRGPGIEPEDRERIFEPFRQLSGRGDALPGTGLGLPIVRQFVTLLGGLIEVSTRDGGGARFAVVLPIDASRRAALDGRAEHAPARAEPAGDRPRVLVVEPDRGRFTALASHLDRRGFLAVRAPDAEEGVRMLRELRPAVVAIDIDPARIEAWSLLPALDRERARGGVPWVLFAFASGSERGVAAGFERCFAGPASASEVVLAIAHGVAPGRPRRESAEVWIAAGLATAPSELESSLAAAGFHALRQPARSRGLAAAAAGGLAAAVIDLGDAESGGLEIAIAGQASTAGRIVWVGLAPALLPSSERRRLFDLAEDATGPAGAAVAAAVERLLRTG
jgi:signal transduction histidine kinase/DNA-binding response OmpR family regulator/streptogramin lyase